MLMQSGAYARSMQEVVARRIIEMAKHGIGGVMGTVLIGLLASARVNPAIGVNGGVPPSATIGRTRGAGHHAGRGAHRIRSGRVGGRPVVNGA